MKGMEREKPLFVCGHRNPDTDSICSAIAYAAYKREVAGEHAVPCRAGNVNSQTRYALERFGAEPPRLLADVLPRLSDIMIPRGDLFLLLPDQPLADAHRIITENRFSFLPVVDEEDRPLGRITTLRLVDVLSHPESVLESVGGDGAGGARLSAAETAGPAQAAGRTQAPGDGATAGRAQPAAPGEPAQAAGPAQAAVNRILGLPLRHFLDPVGPTFAAATPIRDAERLVNRYNEGGFIVTADGGTVAGVVTRMSFLTDARYRLALVDHNEYSQAVDGVELAAVEEIIDHHRIGLERTTEPITVVNRVVGSTCSIVARMYRAARRDPPSSVAGLLLSGLLSDTVVLNSPTTTDEDRELAAWLAGSAGVSVEEYGRAMFAAGSEIASLTAEEIIGKDRKFYEEGGRSFAVSQIEMVGFEAFWEQADALSAALTDARVRHDLYFAALMVTDITTSTTLLVLSAPPAFQSRLAHPQLAPGVYELRDVLSRKKQVLPMLLELL